MKALVLICMLVAGVAGQEASGRKCTLGVDALPPVRDLRLGMTVQEVSQAWGVRIRPKPVRGLYMSEQKNALTSDKLSELIRTVEVGEQEYTVSSVAVRDAVPAYLNGVESIDLRFFDDRLYRVSVSYAKHDFRWVDAAEMASFVGKSLRLDGQPWRVTELSATLECPGFSIVLFSIEERTSLMLAHKALQGQLKSKIKAAVEEEDRIKNRTDAEKKAAFKP
jgi:hypothetical protein